MSILRSAKNGWRRWTHNRTMYRVDLLQERLASAQERAELALVAA